MMFPNQAEYVAEERRKEIERELRRAHMFKSLPRRQAWWSLVFRKSVNLGRCTNGAGWHPAAKPPSNWPSIGVCRNEFR